MIIIYNGICNPPCSGFTIGIDTSQTEKNRSIFLRQRFNPFIFRSCFNTCRPAIGIVVNVPCSNHFFVIRKWRHIKTIGQNSPNVIFSKFVTLSQFDSCVSSYVYDSFLISRFFFGNRKYVFNHVKNLLVFFHF